MPSMGYSQSASPKVANTIHGNSWKKTETNPYWESMNSNTIPTFLTQFFETEDPSKPSEEDITCLFEVLTEVHGPDVILQINYVMDSIIKTLISSSKLDPLQNACKKLVAGIVTYSIHPLIAEDNKREIIYSLYKPLSKCLLGVQEDLVYGSALCLEALICSANWRFASDEIVNDVCLKVTVALEEKPTQTNAHMGLVRALAVHNSITIEPYARSLMRSGVQILNAGVEENDPEKQLSAIKMVNSLMKRVHPRSVFTELETVIKQMETCSSDLVEFVRRAAFEATETARRIIWEKRCTLEESSSILDSNFTRRSNCGSRVSASPRSQYICSSFECDFTEESLVSAKNLPCKYDYSASSVKRGLWKEEVNKSLRSGSYSYSDLAGNDSKIGSKPFYDGKINDNEFDGVFSGCMHTTCEHARATPTSERQSQLDYDDVEFFTTQRELTRCIEDKTPAAPEKQLRRIKRSSSKQVDWSLTGKRHGNRNFQMRADQSSATHERISGSVPARNMAANANNVVSDGVDSEGKPTAEHQNAKQKASTKVGLSLVFGLFIILLIVMALFVWIDNEAGLHFFPT